MGFQRSVRHRFASSVMVQALTQCPAEESEVLAARILGEAGAIVALSCHTFGVHVVRALLDNPIWRRQVAEQASRASKKMMKDKYGRAMLEELGFSKAAAPVTRDVLPQAIRAG